VKHHRRKTRKKLKKNVSGKGKGIRNKNPKGSNRFVGGRGFIT
jgi:hypothetical protein